MIKRKIIIFSNALVFFLAVDLVISKNTDLFKIRKDCFEYIKLEKNNKRYYTYFLSKNCQAFEHKGATPSYKVYTDENGNRYGKNKKKNNALSKVIFLGDSFTYGFGVNFKDSIPGIISEKIKNDYEVINFAVPGYSPSMNYFKLREFLEQNISLRFSKIIYLLDLTDVHDEANRWQNINSVNSPVIADQVIEREIKKNFDLKKNFRTTRFIIYHINNYIRNAKKNIKKFFLNSETRKVDIKGTYWGSFTHTAHDKLLINQNYSNHWKNDIQFGLDKINLNIKEISKLASKHNAEFYIAIHPWRETIDFGQNHFNWEKYALNLCDMSNCKKLINFFDNVREFKEINPDWKTQLYFKNDLHFNKDGNRLYSEKILTEAFK